MKVQLHLVSKRILVGPREGIRAGDLFRDAERRHDRILLVDLDARRQQCAPVSRAVDSQLLPLIKVHHVFPELECGQHVQHLSDVRIRAFN